jgi:hypothetical protein
LASIDRISYSSRVFVVLSARSRGAAGDLGDFMSDRSSVRIAAAIVAAVVVALAAPAQVSHAPEFLSAGRLHRAPFERDDARLSDLRARGAVVRELDYGAFVYAIVDETPLGGRDALLSTGVAWRDFDGVVGFNEAAFDAADPNSIRTALEAVPPRFFVDERIAAGTGVDMLFVVQFVGPIRDAWLERMRSFGGEVVHYVPSNAYVVHVRSESTNAFEAFRRDPAVQWSGVYQPWWKLAPTMRRAAFDGRDLVPVVVQALLDRGAAELERLFLDAGLPRLSETEDVLVYRNLTYGVPAELIPILAASPAVFAIEPKPRFEKRDEIQNQIVAGNLNGPGTAPSGPGYLAWLLTKGFASSGQFAFAVDVMDDGVDRGSTTDVNDEFKVEGLAANPSRVVYNNNYTSDPLADGGDGHGNINASIIGGYNDFAGTAFNDAAGYKYGLGVAPFVQIGNSKVFDNNGNADFFNSNTTRISNAYGGGARVGSNSWGEIANNAYSTSTQTHDTRVRDAQTTTTGHQEFAIVFAAGNDGSGANTVSAPATGKNIICVGASENVRQNGTDGCGYGNSSANNAQDVISFSSRGPCSDGRVKPDIMAPGVHILGAASRSLSYDGGGVCDQYEPAGQTLYCQSTGTSHSCPAVAGGCALVRQYFLNQGWGAPSPAMTKAVLMGTASQLSGVSGGGNLPNNTQGMGLLNLGRAFDGAVNTRVDQSVLLASTGASHVVGGSVVNTSLPFRVALVWTDAPGATTGNAWVNNLDLSVVVGGSTYKGNVFSGGTSTTGGVADSQNNAEFVFLPPGTTGAYTITVTAANIAGDGVPGNGDSTDQDFALFIYNGSTCAPPTITTHPSSATLCEGGLATLSCAATGASTFQWRKDGQNVLGATSATLAFNPAAASDSGSYECVATSACGSAAITNAATLTVNAAPSFVVQPVSQSPCAGTFVFFTASAVGASPVTYQWRKNGANIPGAVNPTYFAGAASVSTAGTYDCVATNGCGFATSQAATLAVGSPPSITTQPSPQSACLGQSASFVVVASGSALSYQWRKNAANISGATASTYSIASVVAGDAASYDCVVSSGCGSTTSNAAALSILAQTQITSSPTNVSTCTGQQATFSVGATGVSLAYQWRKGGVPIGGATGSSYSIASVVAGDAGSYDCVVTGACGLATSASATLTVTAAATFVVHPQGQTVCAGAIVFLNAAATGAGPIAYQWRKNGANIPGATTSSFFVGVTTVASSGTYECVATNGCGATVSNPAVVTVNGAPVVTTPPSSVAVCPGDPAAFVVVVTATSPSYQWRKNGTNIPGATASTYAIAAASASDVASYDCVISSPCGSSTSSSAALTLNVAPSFTSHPIGASLCSGGGVVLNAAAVGTPPPTYQWRKNGSPIGGATGSSYALPAATGSDSGTYDCLATNPCGSVASNAAVVLVQTAPSITSLNPALSPILAPGSPPVSVTVAGSCFTPTSQVVAHGFALATTYVSPTTLLFDLPSTIPQTQVRGAVVVNVQNGPTSISNTEVVVFGGGSNKGTMHREPLVTNPGDFFEVVMEDCEPFSPFTVILDFGVGTPVYPFLDATQNLVLAVSPATGSAGPMLPIFDGLGFFGPPDGSAFDANGGFRTIPFQLPNPALGVVFTTQAVYLDAAAPNGFRLTWARWPDTF